jgi:hypothetical protein
MSSSKRSFDSDSEIQAKPGLRSEEQDKCYICYEEQSEENMFVDPNPCNC